MLPWIVLFAVPLLTGLYALWLGQDASWDLRNYHFYNPYAFLHNRMGYDIAVSHIATYYNPLMHLPFYYAVTTLPPKAVGFLLGMIPGFNGLLLYVIARHSTAARTGGQAWISVAVALAGLLGAVNLSEMGTSYGDNVLSMLILAAIWLILARRRDLGLRSGLLIAAAAGLLSGAAFGLKQPFAIYSVALCAAFFGLDLSLGMRVGLAFVFGLGVLAGVALTDGFWMAEMWHRYGNPLFPYFNEIFRSPWGAPGSYRDERFLPQGFREWLFFPFRFAICPTKVGEVYFRDLRFPMLYVLLIVLLIKKIAARAGGRTAATDIRDDDDARQVRRFILIFFVVSFLLWMKMFAVYRYIAVLEMLAPLEILLVWTALVKNRRAQLLLTAGCLLIILVSLSPGDWGRHPWGSDYFGVRGTVPPVSADSLVLSAGSDPMAYMIPFFPPQVRFLRIQGYMTGPSDSPNDTDRLMRQLIADHHGPIYILYRSVEIGSVYSSLEAYDLEVSGECREITPAIEPQQEHPFYMCRIEKRKP